MVEKKYIYGGVEYRSEREVRKAIFQKERHFLGRTPVENVTEFWGKHNVVYSETEKQLSLEELKIRKAFEVKQAFLRWRNSSATLISSLGFLADSNERTKSDVESLLDIYEVNPSGSITFRDANNVFHDLSLEDLKLLKKEIINNGLFAYQQKWQFDALIESATSADEIKNIKVEFVGKDYTMKE